ncbi:MAG TPA: hypothetical protein VFQ35_01310 [Polyangiaceae bacterium]|nr:hypothetical protein [Polyangiaceae bacterium]
MLSSSTPLRSAIRPSIRLAVLLLLAAGCARTRTASEQASPRPSNEPQADICAALRQPGSLRQRFEKQLPLRVGGVVWALQGAQASDVERAFASLELSGTRVVRCEAGEVVAWAPGVDDGAVQGLEAAMRSSAANLKVLDREVMPPEAAAAPKPKRD